jgi:hypothetical protein
VRSRGTAHGDLALPGCDYASLRNEAFVPVAKVLEALELPSAEEGKVASQSVATVPVTHVMQLEYPPNDLGWNAAGHSNPLLETIFFLREVAKSRVATGSPQQLRPEAQCSELQSMHSVAASCAG